MIVLSELSLNFSNCRKTQTADGQIRREWKRRRLHIQNDEEEYRMARSEHKREKNDENYAFGDKLIGRWRSWRNNEMNKTEEKKKTKATEENKTLKMKNDFKQLLNILFALLWARDCQSESINEKKWTMKSTVHSLCNCFDLIFLLISFECQFDCRQNHSFNCHVPAILWTFIFVLSFSAARIGRSASSRAFRMNRNGQTISIKIRCNLNYWA